MRYASVVLIGIVFFCLGCGRSADRDTVEITGWEMEGPVIKDTIAETAVDGWHPVEIPGMFPPPSEPGPGYRYVLLRAGFTVETTGTWHGLSVGRIYFLDSVYINGTKIGGRSADEFQEFHYPRYYELPESLLRKGTNEIMIQVGTYGREYGGIQGRVSLLSKKAFLKNRAIDRLVFQQLPIGIMVFFSGLCFLVPALCIPGEKVYPSLIVVALMCVWVCHLFTIVSPWHFVDIDVRISFLWASSFMASLLFFFFVQSYYDTWLTKVNMIYTPFVVMCILITLTFNKTFLPYYPGRYLGVANLGVVILVHLLFFYRISGMTSRKIMMQFLLLGFLPGVLIAADIVNYLYIQHIPPLFHVYSIPVMILLFFLLHRRYLELNKYKLIRLRETLETLQENVKGNDKPPEIPEGLEEKLNRLVNYLQNNFTGSVSREELADIADLSPDYMSRMFKTYTGQKLNDYIKGLRIREACKLLVVTDRKISDIAVSTGFESITTFNRAFTSITGEAPGRYRAIHTSKQPGVHTVTSSMDDS